MVLKPEPIFEAVEALKPSEEAGIVLLTPQGRLFSQAIAGELTKYDWLILICGHYEGVDERISQALVTDEISIGDYILTNGTLAATVVIDAVVRVLPNVLGAEGAAEPDSFSAYQLEHPQYTRPEEFRGMKVPLVLLSGNHSEIKLWQNEQSNNRTRERRPDLTK